MQRRTDLSSDELLQQDRSTPEEAAELPRIGIDGLRHAAFAGEVWP